MIKFSQIFCNHDYNLVATDESCEWHVFGAIHLSFYACEKCQKRRVDSSGKNVKQHGAANAFMSRWVEAGCLPESATQVEAIGYDDWMDRKDRGQ